MERAAEATGADVLEAGPGRPAAGPRRARARANLRRAAWLVAAVLAFVLITHAAGAWYFSSVLYDRALSAESRWDALVADRRIEAVAVAPGTVTLDGGDDARLTRGGVFGLEWEGGWGIVGEVLDGGPGGPVTRQFEHRAGAELRPGMATSIDTRVYQGDPAAAGVAFEQVSITGDLGQYPAWYVPGRGRTWFIFVHGNGMTQRDGLRVVPAVARAGLPVLVPTYRNDQGAPANANRRLTYGKEEWRDLEAAVRYALDNGAGSVVLEGMSMGGAVVAAFLLESELAGSVAGVVLDAPVLDFERSVEFQAEDERVPLLRLPLPPTLVTAAEWLTDLRFGVDWSYTHYLDRAGEFSAPMLLVHGDDDEDVPLGTTEELARARPDLVRDVYIAAGAGHVEAWNVAPAEYERRVLAFLASLGVTQ